MLLFTLLSTGRVGVVSSRLSRSAERDSSSFEDDVVDVEEEEEGACELQDLLATAASFGWPENG